MAQTDNQARAHILGERQGIEDRLLATCRLDELAAERLKRKIQIELDKPGLPALYEAALHHEYACLLGLQLRYPDAMKRMELAKAGGLERFALAISKSHLALLSGEILCARETLSSISEVPDESRALVFSHHVLSGMLGSAMNYSGTSNISQASVRAAGAILESLDVDDIEGTKRLDVACKVIVAESLQPITGYKLFAMEGEGILYRFVVRAGIDELALLNERIIEALVDQFDGELDQELSICVTPWVSGDDYKAEEAHHVSIG